MTAHLATKVMRGLAVSGVKRLWLVFKIVLGMLLGSFFALLPKPAFDSKLVVDP